MESFEGGGEEPNIRISSGFIYVQETKQLMQKDGQGTFFFLCFCKIFISERFLRRRWSGEEKEHPEMVKVKSQVKVKKTGGKRKQGSGLGGAGGSQE